MSLSPDAIVRQSQSLRTPARWRSAPIPDGFGDNAHTGLAGLVELPLRLDWSPGGITRDLNDPVQRRFVYQVVLRIGTAEDVEAYVDPVLLLGDWETLVLPDAVKETWQPWITQQAS